ncbi:hypothetical protein EMIHUDRAFT_455390 [Emiliania huxleyi CCMP1516]|uniref:EF-hand domain-containing protein n=3 Tax=Emiliania huxleyi TaxID=2903 RepID=A0A0D3KH18_EMIH1|nr:hypothetical protein EMIHUDRAFT_455390 [Emiliania huxleyi CCMP1516]EOD35053.1 hypothetical protein EMIHUDRAFT_455390 [Emiliania huxleyi CCMP1516]|eukprot:XP_005787482.1 hypothetical protein EMIHUDRAFT_455390 [Emiliania huxleyi CCMP1516]
MVELAHATPSGRLSGRVLSSAAKGEPCVAAYGSFTYKWRRSPLQAPGETRRASTLRLRESLQSGDRIDLEYYQPAARHYAWARYAKHSRDWRLHLQLFLEDWQSSLGAFLFSLAATLAIFAQVVMMLLETNSFGLRSLDDCALWLTGWALTGAFTVELILRTISKRSVGEMCLSAYWWVDVVSVVPDYVVLTLDLAAGSSHVNQCANHLGDSDNVLQVLSEVLRCFRVVRILKIARLNPDTTVIFRAISLSMRALLVPLTFLLIGAFFFGAVIYYLERIELVVVPANDNRTAPAGETPFNDLGEAIWCMIVTFTTVGYGDVSPESHLGKVVCSLAIITGIILLAMPLAIVGNNFSMAWEEREMMQFVLQVQRKCIDRNISLAGIQVLFEEADTHGSGYLDYLEFRRFCEDLGLDHSPSEASEAGLTHTGPDLRRSRPDSRSGGITFFEYCHHIFPDLDVEWLAEHGIRWNDKAELRHSGRSAAGGLGPPAAHKRCIGVFKQASRSEALAPGRLLVRAPPRASQTTPCLPRIPPTPAAPAVTVVRSSTFSSLHGAPAPTHSTVSAISETAEEGAAQPPVRGEALSRVAAAAALDPPPLRPSSSDGDVMALLAQVRESQACLARGVALLEARLAAQPAEGPRASSACSFHCSGASRSDSEEELLHFAATIEARGGS